MRGYYPGEREYRERPQPRIRRPRVPDRPPAPEPPAAPEPPGQEQRPERRLLKRPRRARGAEAGGAGTGAIAAGGGVEDAPAGRTASPAATAARTAHRRTDWVLGILLGIALGILVVVSFLLFGSEGTIDAPSIHGVQTGKPAQHAPATPGSPAVPASESPPPAGE